MMMTLVTRKASKLFFFPYFVILELKEEFSDSKLDAMIDFLVACAPAITKI